MCEIDQDFAAVRNVIASLLTPNGPLQIYTTNALTALVIALPCQCVKPVACDDKPDGFTITEWAAFSCKKSAIASSIARRNGELKAKLASFATDGSKEKAGIKESGVDPWALAVERGQSSRGYPTSNKDYGNAWSSWLPSCEPLNHESVDACAVVGAVVVAADTESRNVDAEVEDGRDNLINPERAVIRTPLAVPREDEIVAADIERKGEDFQVENGKADLINPVCAVIPTPLVVLRKDEIQPAAEIHGQHADVNLGDEAVLTTLQGCAGLAFWTLFSASVERTDSRYEVVVIYQHARLGQHQSAL